MTRLAKLLLVPIVSLTLTGCAVSSFSQQPAQKLTTGFWYWQGSSINAAWSGGPLDALYVQVGTILAGRGRDGAAQWFAYGSLPEDLPAAREYWLVYRFNRQGVPDVQAVPVIGREISRLQAEARKRHLNVAGIQLDVDSPTSALGQYAKFLHEVRKTLPQGMEVSITALLDWFRSGTAIGDVVREVDEFVPQFYDLGDPSRYSGDAAIAAKVDAGRWGPVFNRFQKRFRVGISTFGRARMLPKAASSPSGGYLRISMFGDLGLMDIATNPAFELETDRNPANEVVLTYRATRAVQISYSRFHSGDAVQFILATPESVRAAVDSARKMGGYFAGVVFFRWPAPNETLAMQPDEVLIAAGISTHNEKKQNRVEVVNGHCAAVECVDVYLEDADPFFSKPARYRIRSSVELEYFLPGQNMPIRMVGPSQLELSLPPYCGRGRLYLGRAVTAVRSHFTVEKQ